VVIHGKERPFGVLGAYTARRREFTTPEVLFVQAVAHVLATSIERARVEDALRRSEEHFRSLIENASDIVTIITDDGVFRYVSPSVERLLGYRAGDLLGQTAFAFMHPDDLGDVLEAIQLAIGRPGTTHAAQFRFRHEDGSWRVLESIGMARRDGPDAYSIVVNSRDITERERQEQALRASKERLRTVVAGAPVILFALDRKGDFTFAEGKGLDLLGVRPGQLVGRSAFVLFADLPDVLGHVRRALQGETFSATVDIFGLQFEAWFSPLREGGRIGGIIGVATDITERRRAEEALQRSGDANRHLLAHAPFGIYRVGPDGRFLSVNPALVEMLGYESAEALEGGVREPDIYVEPLDRERYLGRLSAGQRAAEMETYWARRDGKVIRVRLYGRAVRHDDGRIECFELFAEDVTDRRMLEDQLRQSQKMEALGQLTGGIAHDFNNLLTVILANAELLQREFAAARPQKQADIRDIISAALSGRMMVNQLLGFARRSSLSLEAVHLGHALLDLAAVLRRVLPEDIEMLVFADEDLAEVQADLHAVEQMLFNLVNNARDAMPHGGVLRIETSCTWLTDEQRETLGLAATREYVCLAVDDTGQGMDEATRQRVFEPFFTTKAQGKGTGLGLATVYGLVRQHGGFIQVDSTPGAGTRVRVYFPVAEEPAGIVETAGQAAPARGGHETILVVEDQIQLRRATTLILEEAGYTVLAAADGHEALEVLRHRPAIDLVLTDVVMPRLSGRALHDQARREGKAMPFLFASGYVGIAGGDREPLDPALPFLRKPWSRADLLARLRELLDRPTAGPGLPVPASPILPA
ncbi:MAG: PAS domain S-box protein, partial [Gemmatimonadales bacterium]